MELVHNCFIANGIEERVGDLKNVCYTQIPIELLRCMVFSSLSTSEVQLPVKHLVFRDL